MKKSLRIPPYFKFIVFIAFSFVVIMQLTASVSALSGNEFQPGRIIDDSIFYDYDAITTDQIQLFLNAKMTSCDTYGEKMYTSTQTRAQWAASNGRPTPPYTCLKDYSQNIPGITNGGSDLCKRSVSGGTKTAAQLIKDAAYACGINPQVLIVMLQKEQSLITDDWPWPSQYDKAMGYACPDSGPNNSANCDSAYFGFFNQVYNAAKAFRRYEANPNSYNYRAKRNNTILYHPNSVCGTSNVFIENQATASLYIYTPYRPNQAALNNLYGTGDSCSAYGNRNFWRMFNDWFGSTVGSPDYSWSVVSQKAYTDSTKSIEIPNYSPTLSYRNRAFLTLTVRNDGNRVWDKSVKLATDSPQSRSSQFCDIGWIQCVRAATLQELSVAPGETGTFQFWIKAPEEAGQYNERFNLIKEGVTWFPTQGLYYPITVIAAPNYGLFTSEKFYTSDDKKIEINRNDIQNNRRYYVVYIVKNIGSDTWSNSGSHQIRLGTRENVMSKFCDPASWLNCARPTILKEAEVKPGDTGTFSFWIKSSFSLDGTKFLERYRLLIENLQWFNYPSIDTQYISNTPRTSWRIDSSKSFTSSSMSTLAPTNNLSLNEERFVVLKAQNLSGKVWRRFGPNPIRLATNSPPNVISRVCHEVWVTCNRPSGMEEETVNPGEVATFKFWVRGKDSAINYNENYVLISENKYWLGNAGLVYHFKVVN